MSSLRYAQGQCLSEAKNLFPYAPSCLSEVNKWVVEILHYVQDDIVVLMTLNNL